MNEPNEPKHQPLKVGDVVELRSGGPQMTVISCNVDVAWCAWFADGIVCTHRFPCSVLDRDDDSALEGCTVTPESIDACVATEPFRVGDVDAMRRMPCPGPTGCQTDTQAFLLGALTEDRAPPFPPADPTDPVAAFTSSWRDRPPAWQKEGGGE